LSELSSDGGEPSGFLVDKTAGRLARWLRILGLDTEYIDTCDVSAIVRRARHCGRTVITRNHSVVDRLGGTGLMLESDRIDEQIGQVVEKVGYASLAPFSRCNTCNRRLVPVARQSVRGRVPAYVYRTHERFSMCPVCGRYYWQGTHWNSMHRRIESITGGIGNGDK
jgi:uncharacterized protein with PIN domain